MPRKPKIKIVRKPIMTKAMLIALVKDYEIALTQARNLIEAMQTEIKQLSNMHRTQLQIIDNLSRKVAD